MLTFCTEIWKVDTATMNVIFVKHSDSHYVKFLLKFVFLMDITAKLARCPALLTVCLTGMHTGTWYQRGPGTPFKLLSTWRKSLLQFTVVILLQTLGGLTLQHHLTAYSPQYTSFHHAVPTTLPEVTKHLFIKSKKNQSHSAFIAAKTLVSSSFKIHRQCYTQAMLLTFNAIDFKEREMWCFSNKMVGKNC